MDDDPRGEVDDSGQEVHTVAVCEDVNVPGSQKAHSELLDAFENLPGVH
jgi:hypothetical protein